MYGTTKTSKWALAAFKGSYKRKSGMITASLGSVAPGVGGSAGINFSMSISNQTLPPGLSRAGPAPDTRPSRSGAEGHPTAILAESGGGVEQQLEPSEVPSDVGSPAPLPEEGNQTIFLRYYKMKRRHRILNIRPMKAAAGPDERPSDSEPDKGDIGLTVGSFGSDLYVEEAREIEIEAVPELQKAI